MTRSQFKTIWNWPNGQSCDENVEKAYPKPETAKPVETEQQKQERMWAAIKDACSG